MDCQELLDKELAPSPSALVGPQGQGMVGMGSAPIPSLFNLQVHQVPHACDAQLVTPSGRACPE